MAWTPVLRRYWWLVAVVLGVVIAYRYFNPAQPTLNERSGVECADKYAIAVVDPVPVAGSWDCGGTNVKAVWGDVGHVQDQGIADWANGDFAANSVRYIGKSHHIPKGTDPAILQTDPTDLPPDEYYSLYGLWLVFDAEKDQGLCISFNGGCQPEHMLIFIQMDQANISVNQWDFGFCASGLYGSIDCASALSKVGAT